MICQKMRNVWMIVLVIVCGCLPIMAQSVVVHSLQVENVVGMGQVDPTYVMAYVQTKVGEPFRAEVAAQDVRRLLDTGRFSDVDVSVERRGMDDVDVTFQVQPRLRLIGQPRVTGLDAFSERKVQNWLDLTEGTLVDDQVAGVALQRVLSEYRKKHYLEASGSWSFDILDEKLGTTVLTFHIEEGRRGAVREITVEGNEAISRRAMRKALLRPHPLNILRWFVAKRYRSEDFDEMAANVRRMYLDRGYLDVSVDVEVASPSEKKGTVFVDEGPLYRIADVEVEGVTVFDLDVIRPMFSHLSGEPASLLAINEVADRMEGYYGDRGYINANVRPVAIPDLTNHLVTVSFPVREGEISHLRSVQIRGNSRTRDKVIRRELLIKPGEIYNRARVQRSERRLRNLGFFETVYSRTVPTAEPGMHDLVFDVNEKRTGQFMVGVGFSSIDNLLGFVELSQGNFDLLGWPYFTGGGQKLRLRAQAGSTRQDYELSFVEPWFLDRKISFGLDLYRRERQFSEYDLKRTGAAISLGKALPFASRLNVSYMIEKSVITDITDTNTYFHLDSYDFETGTGEPYLFASEEDRLKSAFTVSLTQDVRNNPFVPTRGHRIHLFYTLSGGPLSGDIDMFHTGFRHAVYVPLWFGHTFSLRTRGEFVDSFGDTDLVPLAERLFTGGARSIRGFRYRDVGPKVIRPLETDGDFQHRPFGGMSLFVANLEYTMPIVDSVRVVTFYDVGNVWEDHFDIDFQDVASSVGVGLRFDLPGFPIRLDRAWPVERDDRFTDEDAWSISIGYDF